MNVKSDSIIKETPTQNRPRSRQPRTPADAVAHAVAHRIRVDILTVLHEGPASQKQLAAALRESLSSITYHVKELSRAEAIEVAYTKKVGRLDQNYWRAIKTSSYSPRDLAELTIDQHAVLSRIIVQSIIAEMLASLRAGKLAGDPYAATAWDRVLLDDQGYKALNDATDDYLGEMYRAAAESATRRTESGETLKPYIGAVMAFERCRTEPNTTVSVGEVSDGALVSQSEPSGAGPALEGGMGRAPADAVAHAVAHRIRVDILTLLHDGPASQKELAAALDESRGNIAHHIQELKEAEAIEVAHTKVVRNVEQKFWRALKTSTYWPEDLAKLTLEEHAVLSRIIVQSIIAEMLAALRSGKLAGDAYAATAWDRVWLDDRGYRDLSRATGTFLLRMYEIAAEAKVRSDESAEPLKVFVGAVMAFRRSRVGPNTTSAMGWSQVGELPGSSESVDAVPGNQPLSRRSRGARS